MNIKMVYKMVSIPIAFGIESRFLFQVRNHQEMFRRWQRRSRTPLGSAFFFFFFWFKTFVIIMNITPEVLTSNISPWHGSGMRMVREKTLPI